MMTRKQVIEKLTSRSLEEEPLEAYHAKYGRLHVYRGGLYFNDKSGASHLVQIQRGNFVIGTANELYRIVNNLA